MNLHLLLSALRARWGLFLFIFVATVLAAAGVSMIMPKTYTANVSLLVDNKDDQSLANGAMVPVRERAGYMQTQIDLITSPRVARKVVTDLKLADDPALHDAYEKATNGRGAIEDWLAEGLLKKLKVDTSQSSVIQVSFASPDPDFSAAVANAFAKAYTDMTLELRVDPSRETASWFDEQLKDMRRNYEQAQARLAAYQKEKGIVNVDEHFDVENTALNDLSAQVVKAQEQTYEALSRQAQAGQLADAAASREKMPEILANPFVQTIKTDLVRAETKLQELSTRLGSGHPLYQSQLAETKGLRDRLNAETSKIVAGLDASVRQSRQREANLRAALAAQRARVLNMKEAQSQLRVMMRDAEIAQRTYETAMQRAVGSRVESRARLTNVSVLSPAVAPFVPTRPRVAINIALAAIVGLLLGLSVIYMLEAFDRRVRSLDDLEESLRVPMLAELKPWRPPSRGLLGRVTPQALPGPG